MRTMYTTQHRGIKKLIHIYKAKGMEIIHDNDNDLTDPNADTSLEALEESEFFNVETIPIANLQEILAICREHRIEIWNDSNEELNNPNTDTSTKAIQASGYFNFQIMPATIQLSHE